MKFYTGEGNWDLVGNNTPVFFVRDPYKFSDFIRTQKRDPATNLRSATAMWDFWSLSPESLHQVTILFSDRGVPATFRNMHGFTSHTYKWYNELGQYFWIKLHFKTEQGIKNLTAEEAEVMKGKDPDHATRDLHDAIERGEFPSWKVEVQIMTPEQADKYRFDPFDITKVWPHGDVPPMTIGRMVLNRNPSNYFAEVEQSAFSPANFVPGIGASPDKLLQGRLFSYHDTHRHRLGANYHLIPVNSPKGANASNYQRDGPMMTGENGGGAPNYYPNSFQGPAPNLTFAEPPFDLKGKAARQPHDHPNSDFVQPGALYSKVMNEAERERLVSNIVGHLGGAQKRIQYRQAAIFYLVAQDYGKRVAEGLMLDLDKVKELAAMDQEERVKATS